MERVIGGIERRVLKVYGRSLWFFLRHRWISAVIWVVCLAGTAYLFYIVPKAFLPVGDSSFIRGVIVAQEGSSPDQMPPIRAGGRGAARQSRRGHDLHHDRKCAFSRFEPGLLLAFLKDPDKRPPIAAVAGQLMGAINARFPGLMAFLQPNPVLQISTGATADIQGQFAYALSGIDPAQVYPSRAS